MSKMITVTAPHQIGFEEYQEQAPGPNEVRLHTLYPGNSAGAELTA